MTEYPSNIADRIPEIYCAVSLMFDAETDMESVISDLKNIGINQTVFHKPRYGNAVYLDIAVVANACLWSVGDALSAMFSQIQASFQSVRNIVCRYAGKIYIDISFYQYGRYPVLVIDGDNMEKIHVLGANISIDAYDCS